MIIILSQKIDTESAYTGDEVFRTYHYPEGIGTRFIRGMYLFIIRGIDMTNRNDITFGTGWIGNIKTEDEDNYYAELLNVVRFEKKVPIYLPDGGMWNNWAMIPLEKYQSTLAVFGQTFIGTGLFLYFTTFRKSRNDRRLQCKAKKAIQSYYISNDKEAILRILEIAKQLATLYNLTENP